MFLASRPWYQKSLLYAESIRWLKAKSLKLQPSDKGRLGYLTQAGLQCQGDDTLFSTDGPIDEYDALLYSMGVSAAMFAPAMRPYVRAKPT